MTSTSSTIVTTIITDTASIAGFNRGPIPTVFAAPTSCLSTLTVGTYGNSLYFGHQNGGYWDPACYPSPTVAAPAVNPDAAWNLYYYSPAVSCPSGWYNAHEATTLFGGAQGVYLPISSATTAILCCPSGFIASSFEHQCRSNLQLGTDQFLYKQPTQDLRGSWVDPTSPETGTHTVTNTGDWTVYGDGIPIWFQSSDQVAFTASETSLPPISTSPPSTNTNPPTSSSNSLSTGAKAGIGIAVALGVIAIAAIAGFFISKRRKRYHAAPTDGHELHSQDVVKSELHDQDRPVLHELYADDGDNTIVSGRHELHDQR